MTKDDARLTELAEAIAAGTATDWSLAESAAADESTRKMIAELKVIARIAEVHRSAPVAAESPTSSSARAGAGPHEFWGALRLVEKVGRGAYGEVYRAWDTRLDREVALKLLPADLAGGDSRATSIIEEGRLLARVRHPNVVTIHGAERIENRVGLWMEFIRGRTLEQALAQDGTFSAADAVHVGAELCRAVSAVHGAGLLHRDIKAHNVMVAEDGRVVLMDFGTGRERGNAAGAGLAGTPLYLAPELLQEQEATVRSDIYSVGVLLYHLLTGSYPVRAQSLHELRLAHERLERQQLKTARPDLPPRLARIIERAIDPRPEGRYDTAVALEADLTALTARPRLVRLASAAAMTALLTASAAALVWTNRADTSAARAATTSRTGVRVVPLTALPGEKMFPALSPDGSRVAFMWDRGRGHDIYVKDVDRDATLQLTRSPGGGGSYPVWSPDGRRIAFLRRTPLGGEMTRDAILIVPAHGGFETTVFTDPVLRIGVGLDWSPDGEHLLLATSTPGQPARLMLVSVAGAERRWLTSPPQGSAGDNQAVFSPDGGSIAFVRNTESQSALYVLTLTDAEPRHVKTGSFSVKRPAWTSDGGTLIFASFRGVGQNSLWTVPVEGGEPEPVSGSAEGAAEPSAARVGNRLVFKRSLLDTNVYRAELTEGGTGSSTPLAATSRQDTQPQISPDGSRVAFVSDRTGHSEIWVISADGSNPRPVTELKTAAGSPRWSPDGQHIVFNARASAANQLDILIVGAEGGAVRRLTFEASNEQSATWSADQRWIYFSSNRTGRWEVWSVPAQGGPAVQVTRSGGLKVQESADGRVLYYSNDTYGVWRAPAGGAAPELVLRFPTGTPWGGEWVLARSGIFWVNEAASPRSAIEFFRFATGTSSRAFTAPGVLNQGGGFSVSPDGRWLVFTQRDYLGSDIMMIEGS